MTVYATAIHLAGGAGHEHIASARWLDSGESKSNIMTRQQWVDWLQNGHRAFVADATGPVEIKVVNANPPYIRTMRDGRPTDNLLALPRY